ncbi:hypothetical protein [Mesotoga sp. UBA6090]|uniref:hypothetical protein n=1 Tax=Mesotoga sp. UBA6090 TaxID=1946860 RepID=UPI0025F83C69|nr:hypothetical protein [Mesotoga sp. UBA6090]
MYIITENGFALNLTDVDCIVFKENSDIIYDKGHCRVDKEGNCIHRKDVEIYASKHGGSMLIKTVKTAAEAKKYIADLLKRKGEVVLTNSLMTLE